MSVFNKSIHGQQNEKLKFILAQKDFRIAKLCRQTLLQFYRDNITSCLKMILLLVLIYQKPEQDTNPILIPCLVPNFQESLKLL